MQKHKGAVLEHVPGMYLQGILAAHTEASVSVSDDVKNEDKKAIIDEREDSI